MKMTVFWVVAPCSLIEVYQRFRGPCCLRHQGPDDGSSKYLCRNVGKLLPDYTALQPRRQPSSYKLWLKLKEACNLFVNGQRRKRKEFFIAYMLFQGWRGSVNPYTSSLNSLLCSQSLGLILSKISPAPTFMHLFYKMNFILPPIYACFSHIASCFLVIRLKYM
jgi:hypothetical protein